MVMNGRKKQNSYNGLFWQIDRYHWLPEKPTDKEAGIESKILINKALKNKIKNKKSG